jgi:glycosyltransferase involved in cell wall biosynthesis
MRVLLLIRSRGLPSSRYRVLQYLPALEQAGIEVEVAKLPSGWRARRKLFRHGREFDCVLLQKRLLRPSLARSLRQFAKRLVYDFDDAVLYHSPSSDNPESATRRKRFESTVGAADVVLAGNAFLKELAEPFAQDVRLLPTALDPRKYDEAVAAHVAEEEGIVLGWIGSKSTVDYLCQLREPLERIGAEYANVRLRVVCNEFPIFENIQVEAKEWSKANEAADVAGMDIGLAPVGDDPWSKGKCGLKMLQYLAASKPVVCSPIGAQTEIVQDGVNGYWASDADEWYERLKTLIDSADERKRMGDAGRKHLEERYTIAANAPALIAALTGEACVGNDE